MAFILTYVGLNSCSVSVTLAALIYSEQKCAILTTPIWLDCFLKAQCFFHQLFSRWSYPVKIIQWQWRLTVCHLTKTFFPSEEQWGESKTKSSEEWRASRRAGRVSAACLGSGSFPPTTRWGPRRVDVLRRRLFPVSDGERGASDRNSAFVFLDRKTSGQAVNVSHVCKDVAGFFS